MSTPPPPAEKPTFSHLGTRYLLGYAGVEYGIWDRQAPGPPIRRFPRTDKGWAQAWDAYQELDAPPTPAKEVPSARPPVSPAAPTAPLPAAEPAGPSMRITPQLVAQVLTVTAWAALAVFPLAGIARLTQPTIGFFGVMEGLSFLALGVALWGICLTLAKVARRNR